MDNFRDRQIGFYRLVRLLGHGDLAAVYLAEHVHSLEHVALKLLNPRDFDALGSLFTDAARTMARLEHPHIVRLLNVGEQGSGANSTFLYFALSYALHGSTRQRQQPGTPIALPTLVGYVRQSAEALQFAHAQGIPHLRLKPENILVGAQNEILLSDFGFTDSRFSSAQHSLSSVLYLAPEQIEGKPGSESDQYALGAIAYEWISGEPPFTGSLREIREQHLGSEPITFRQKGLKVSPGIEQVVMRALKKHPQERFPDSASFALALERASFSEDS